MSKSTKKLAVAAMFATLAYAVAALSNVIPIPLVPSLSFLHYDAKDVIIALCGFILGPLYALAVSLVVALIELTISNTGIIGAVMNFLSSAVFACSAALIYKYKKSIYGAVFGLLAASVLTTAFMLGWNYLISPYYMGVSRDAIAKMLLPGFLPFNLIKSLINSGLTLIIYKPVINALRHTKLIENKGAGISVKSVVISLSIGVTFIIAGIITVVLLKVL